MQKRPICFERRARPDKSSERERKWHVPDDDMKAELERLRRENASLKKGSSDGIRMKVSEKGAVSVYGMGAMVETSEHVR